MGLNDCRKTFGDLVKYYYSFEANLTFESIYSVIEETYLIAN